MYACAVTGVTLFPGTPVVLLALRDVPGRGFDTFQPCLLPLEGIVDAWGYGVVWTRDAHLDDLVARLGLDTTEQLAARFEKRTMPRGLARVMRRLAPPTERTAPPPTLEVAWVHRAVWDALANFVPGVTDRGGPVGSIATAAPLSGRLLRRLGLVRGERDPALAALRVGSRAFARRFAVPGRPEVDVWLGPDGEARIAVAGKAVGPTASTLDMLARALDRAGVSLDPVVLAWARTHTLHTLAAEAAARDLRAAQRARRALRRDLREDGQRAWIRVASDLPRSARQALAAHCAWHAPVTQVYVDATDTWKVTLRAALAADATFAPAASWELDACDATWRSARAKAVLAVDSPEPAIPFPPSLWSALRARGYRTPVPYRLALRQEWFDVLDETMPYVYGRALTETFQARAVALHQFLDHLRRLGRPLRPSLSRTFAPDMALERALATALSGVLRAPETSIA